VFKNSQNEFLGASLEGEIGVAEFPFREIGFPEAVLPVSVHAQVEVFPHSG
jgi:hypothetical protein